MIISGLQKTTLLDYPGHMAATIFLNGCNFCCPFCHNMNLVTESTQEEISKDSLMSFLKKRKGILEGVCITGGEPTIHTQLKNLILDIRSLGYLIKLDTNGSHPTLLKELCEEKLLDYVAMDIKSSRENYCKAAGNAHIDLDAIEESVAFLLHHTVPYEFRTTVVKELHSLDDFKAIGPWIEGCSRYFIQSYQDSPNVMTPGFSACTVKELKEFAAAVSPFVSQVSLRGISEE